METDRIAVKPFTLSTVALIALVPCGDSLLTAYAGLPAMVVLPGLRILGIGVFFGIITIWGNGLAAVGLTRDLFWSGLARGVRWSLIFGAVTAGTFAVLIFAGINPLQLLGRIPLPVPPLQRLVLFSLYALIGPLFEEFFFRGILYGFLRRWGMVIALIISNIAFVLMHQLTGSIPVPQIVGGIVFTLAYERKGELMAPVVIHSLGNTALFSLSLLN